MKQTSLPVSVPKSTEQLVEPVLEERQMQSFAATVRLSFSQRRKQLRNALAAGWGREVALTALAAASIDPRSRAEELSLDRFVRLHRAYLGVDSR